MLEAMRIVRGFQKVIDLEKHFAGGESVRFCCTSKVGVRWRCIFEVDLGR